MMHINYFAAPSVLRFVGARSELIKGRIINAACEYYGVNMEQLTKKTRKRNIVYIRQIIYYLLRTETNMSFKGMAKALGGYNHATVIHSVNKIKELLDINDQDTVNDLSNLKLLIKL
jgi:chromosomal replication initiator protein